MEKNCFLTIDCGTSALKVIVYDKAFRPVARAVQETRTIYPRPNWAEQDPTEWWRAATRCIGKCLERISPDQIIGIGVTSQCHGLVLVDEQCHPLMNCLIWPDLRAISQANELNSSGAAQQHISAHYTAAKLLWVWQYRPDIARRAHKLLIPKDFVRTKLTMDFVTDVIGAGSTQMWDRSTRQWDWPLVDTIGFPREKMAEIRPTEEVVGYVTPPAAAETGLREGTPVIAGQCNGPITPILISLAHQGKVRPEEDYIILYLGTAPSITHFSSRLGFHREYWTRSGPPRPFEGGYMGAGGGGLLKWYKEQFGLAEEQIALSSGTSPYQLLDEAASDVEPGAAGLVFLPHMMGERHPDNNFARGVLYGLSLGHRREQIYRALLEGIIFRMKTIYDQGREGKEIKIDGIIMFGGGTKSRLWRQIAADVFGYPVHTVTTEEAATLNVAVMASVGLEVYPTYDEAARHVDVDLDGNAEVIHPSPGRWAYEKPYALYRKVDECLAPLFTPEWNAY